MYDIAANMGVVNSKVWKEVGLFCRNVHFNDRVIPHHILNGR